MIPFIWNTLLKLTGHVFVVLGSICHFILTSAYTNDCRGETSDCWCSTVICLSLTWWVMIMTIRSIHWACCSIQNVGGQHSVTVTGGWHSSLLKRKCFLHPGVKLVCMRWWTWNKTYFACNCQSDRKDTWEVRKLHTKDKEKRYFFNHWWCFVYI